MGCCTGSRVCAKQLNRFKGINPAAVCAKAAADIAGADLDPRKQEN
ncbi:MAG: hypothetical protein GY874_22770 [Desulfobacteraceae bacterium]|nr:hypothetical protein [Desulfobacteraceae bacterium]